MASQPEEAHNSPTPSEMDLPLPEPLVPSWSKISILGQTTMIMVLSPLFGSPIAVAEALRIRSHEFQQFVDYHRRSIEWVEYLPSRNNSADNENTPQRNHITIDASAIVPACDFLDFMGFKVHDPTLRRWIGKTVPWPPRIDLTGQDFSPLDHMGVEFVTPAEETAYSSYQGPAGNDHRPVLGFVDSRRPKADGNPDVRLSFIFLPEGTIVFGPGGDKKLVLTGRYSFCGSIIDIMNNNFQDFVLAKNETNAKLAELTLAAVNDKRPEALNIDQGTANPRNIFGTITQNGPIIENNYPDPFHRRPMFLPQGASREWVNPGLEYTWNHWPGYLFKIRLPRGYVLQGPNGNFITFDPSQHEKYDRFGYVHGLGGTYLIVPPIPISGPGLTFSTIDPLPLHVHFRFKLPENLVMIRNGEVLPRLSAKGVHEISMYEGFVDLYNANGCYDIFQMEDRRNILEDPIIDQDGEEVNDEDENIDENIDENTDEDSDEDSTHIEQAVQGLLHQQELLASEREEQRRRDAELAASARLRIRYAKDKARREALKEQREARREEAKIRQAKEKEEADAALAEYMGAAQGVRNLRSRRIAISDASRTPTSLPLSQATAPEPTSQTTMPENTGVESAQNASGTRTGKRGPKPMRGRPRKFRATVERTPAETTSLASGSTTAQSFLPTEEDSQEEETDTSETGSASGRNTTHLRGREQKPAGKQQDPSGDNLEEEVEEEE
ncbi:hypothetical protein SAMD00023353_0103960 [Rosellinia necatrix]|uniref:Uncharacterized protein n=1 Tax=Rosellinia necatrix TaxID=77044 RepID=A0A1S8A4S7_ROSNE|nr:hypothetical protein SAMD00023353_0103960 [Rosellinia necatrix]